MTALLKQELYTQIFVFEIRLRANPGRRLHVYRMNVLLEYHGK